MDSGLGILSVFRWIEYFFPSLSGYLETIGPIVICVMGSTSIFYKLLPVPKYKYPVPEIDELTIALSDSSKSIILLAKMSRRITIFVNWWISTIIYKWFYVFSIFSGGFITHLKLMRAIQLLKKIKPPTPFISKISDNEKDK